jgi:hypothetical protein
LTAAPRDGLIELQAGAKGWTPAEQKDAEKKRCLVQRRGMLPMSGSEEAAISK